MDELLTTKQVLNLLKVDRTTIYRMLKDGRLTGIKVGQQWRFPRPEVEALLSGAPPQKTEPAVTPAITPEALPISCLQSVQDVSAETMDVGAIVTDPNGLPLTEISNSSRFCNLILSTESGRQACIASWRKLSRQHETQPQFVTCHAGCHYARARMEVNDQPFGMLVTGQFFITPPDPDTYQRRIQALAQKHGLNEGELAEAAKELRVLSQKKQEKIHPWLQKLADTFSLIGRERAEMLNRLKQIATMSTMMVE